MPPRRHYVHPHDGSCGCDHDDLESGFKTSLYKYIDTAGVQCLNATSEADAVKVFKPYDQRMDMENVVTSDADETLIFIIPFNGTVTLKAIDIGGPSGETHPASMKAFVNRDVDFDSVEELEPAQEWELVDQRCTYDTKVAKFQGVYSLALYFPNNNGADKTVISYIGLYGTCLEMKRDPVICVYELLGNPSDNKAKEDYSAHSGVGY